jgi:hypothetical protein
MNARWSKYQDTPRPVYGHSGKTAGARNENAEAWPVKMILSFCPKHPDFQCFERILAWTILHLQGILDFRFQISGNQPSFPRHHDFRDHQSRR